jgi:oxygen-independent coproporphyrinogen-3 oxidase
VHFSGEVDASISIEAYPDPDYVTLEKLRLLRDMSFTEISFGVQDFDERIQRVINRRCSPAVLRGLVEMARSCGFRVHVDLLYGLPFQGLNELESSIRLIAAMDPDRVAMQCYAHYPFVYPAQRNIPTSSVPNSFTRVLLAMLAEDLLTSAGYNRVGFDYFVKTGDPLHAAAMRGELNRDLMGYSSDERRECLGSGMGAISFLSGAFFHNRRTLDEYLNDLEENRLPLERRTSHRLSADDAIRSRVIQTAVLGRLRIDKGEIESTLQVPFDEYFSDEQRMLSDFADDGLVECGDSKIIRLTGHGRFFARHIAKVFDTYYR